MFKQQLLMFDNFVTRINYLVLATRTEIKVIHL